MRSARIVHGALLLLAAVTSANSAKCSRLIDGVTTPRSYAEGRYNFFMTLYNMTEQVYAYMPNTRYSVTLKVDVTDQLHRKFTRFLISAEAKDANDTADVGAFDIEDDTLAKFADNCANAVVETSMVLKQEITVVWTSPSEGSGCILIRATVVETPDTWYMDDYDLNINICQDSKAEADDQGPVLSKCCACGEAKYEVTFEGLWSRNTHPKDFPSKSWLIRFSDVIGASHSRDYSFWHYNGMASTGLRQVAEHGATRKLEGELKNRSEHIRTIIKARGISYPNVTGRTFAVFRVDNKHHLMSLVSMIDPSPDWIVGVSGLELCLLNCTWIEHKELNLYPYDVGTDDGITYMSPDSPTEPQEPIRRITSTYPNDSRSPFYDPTGLDMKPLAKLYLNRQRLYEKFCNESDTSEMPGKTSPTEPQACKVTPWSEWSPCTVTCGQGTQLRQRHFFDETAANINNCNVPLTGRKNCLNDHNPYCSNSGRHDNILNDNTCELSEWTPWSECSSTCGDGTKMRFRNFRYKKFRKQCKAAPNGPSLQQSIDCENEPCEGEDVDEVSEDTDSMENNYEADDYGVRADENGEFFEDRLQKCPNELYTEWSLWSPCSSSCGPGIRLRSRLLKEEWSSAGKDYEDMHEECRSQQMSCNAEIKSCNFTKEEAEKICSEPMEKGRCSSNIMRSYFDKQAGRCRFFSYTGCDGNRNNFPTEQDCNRVCGSFQKELRANLSAIMKNFKVSLSSVLSYHIPVQEQQRTKTKRAQYEKADFRNIQASSLVMESSEDIKVDCEVTEWSRWTNCDGCYGYKISNREIMVPAKGGGKSCPRKTVRRRKCKKDPSCFEQGNEKKRRSSREKNSEYEAEHGIKHDTTLNKHVSVDCKVTHWSTWSRCSMTCGESMRNRVRRVKVRPRGPWPRLCPPLAEFKQCSMPECPK